MNCTLRNCQETRKGFTLLEVLAVVGLMAILMGVASLILLGNRSDNTTFHLGRELLAAKLKEVQSFALKNKQKTRLAIFYKHASASDEQLINEATDQRVGKYCMAHLYDEDRQAWIPAGIEPLLLPKGIAVDFEKSCDDFLSNNENEWVTWPERGSDFENTHVKGIWLTLAFDEDGRTLKEGKTTEEVVEDDYYQVKIDLSEKSQVFGYKSYPPKIEIPVGEKYFKSGLKEFEQFQRDFDNRHINSTVPNGTIYRKTPVGSARWETEERAFWKDWNVRHDLFAANNHFTAPLKEKQLYLAFGGKEDGNYVTGCLKGAAAWKDITGNIYTYYVDATSRLQVFQWYDVASNYLYRVVVDQAVVKKSSPTTYPGLLNLFATIVEIYERKNEDESGMKFPVVGPGDFIFPARKNPAFSNKEALMEHLRRTFVIGFININHVMSGYRPWLVLNSTYPRTSHFPSTQIFWIAIPGADASRTQEYYVKGGMAIGFGEPSLQPHRKVTITKHTQDSSPIFSITLEPENKSHEEATNIKLGFLVVPQGSLLYFESETELSKLKSTLTAPATNP